MASVLDRILSENVINCSWPPGSPRRPSGNQTKGVTVSRKFNNIKLFSERYPYSFHHYATLKTFNE